MAVLLVRTAFLLGKFLLCDKVLKESGRVKAMDDNKKFEDKQKISYSERSYEGRRVSISDDVSTEKMRPILNR